MHPSYTQASALYTPILDAAYEILRIAGAGLPESFYQHALKYELEQRGHHAEREVRISVPYKGTDLATDLRADIVVDNCFVIELKAVENKIIPQYIAQTLTYMMNLNCPLGLIFNFGASQYQRYRSLIVKTTDGTAAGEEGEAFDLPDDSSVLKRTYSFPEINRRTPPRQPHPRYAQAISLYGDLLAAANEVQKILGVGHLEELYHRALIQELTLRGHSASHAARRTLIYKTAQIDTLLTACILVDDCFVIAPKIIKGRILTEDIVQCLTYMTHLDCPVGLIYNFGATSDSMRAKPAILDGANIGFDEPPNSPFHSSHYPRNRRPPLI